jgi:hypothetical protein
MEEHEMIEVLISQMIGSKVKKEERPTRGSQGK